MSGKLVIIEGGEGSGKTTLIANLLTALEADGISVITTREPGGTAYAEEVRAALIKKRDNTGEYPTPLAQLLGFYSARFDHIEKVILPALNAGTTVLCDRFELTSYAYQVHALDRSLHNQFVKLHDMVCELLAGHELMYVLCDIDPEVGVRRALARADENTSFDEKNMDFHYQAHEGRQAAQKVINDCFAFHSIDAVASPEAMVAATRTIIGL
jgi:dTMP kinase